jgi:hypothetical protein
MTAEQLSELALRYTPPLVSVDDIESALSPETVQALIEHGLAVVPVCIGRDTYLCCSSSEAVELLVRLADRKARRLTTQALDMAAGIDDSPAAA